MVAVRKTIAGVAMIAAVAVDVLGGWTMITQNAAVDTHPAGTSGIAAFANAAGQAQISASTNQLNPLAGKQRRRKKS